MAKSPKDLHIVQRSAQSRRLPATRVNEGGASIAVKFTSMQPVDGITGSKFEVNLQGTEVPTRRYVVDTCELRVDDYSARILCAQRNVADGAFRSVLVVHLSFEGMQNLTQSITSIVNPSVKQLAQQLSIDSEPLHAVDGEFREMASVTVNFSTVAISGREGCIDCYYASPFAMRALTSSSKEMAVEPVVRLDIRTSLLLSLEDALVEALENVPLISRMLGNE